MKNYIFPKPFLLLTIFLSFFLLTSSKSNAGMFNKKNEFLETPISVPFDISKKGNEIEFLMKPRETYTYRFSLEYHYYSPLGDSNSKYYIHPLRRELSNISFLSRNFKYFRIEFTEKEREEIGMDGRRIRKELSGGWVLENGEGVTYPGVPVLAKITIIELGDKKQKIIFDQTLEPEKDTNAGGGYFHKTLTAKPVLQKGKIYKIIATSMKNAPELSGEKIHLGVINDRPK